MAQDELDAELAAFAIVYGHKGVTMITRLETVDCVA